MADTPEEETPETYAAEDQDSSGNGLRSRLEGRGPLIIAVIATAASLALLCLFAYLLLRPDETGEQEPTPDADAEQVEVELDTDTFEYQAIGDTGAITLTMETPVFLEVAGEDFTVMPEVLPASGPWNPPVVNETTAAWVYGSVINYVFGLEDNSQNQELLESLAVGDSIALTARSGASIDFIISDRIQADSDDREIFAQREPSVTLLLIEENVDEQRTVVKGRYVVPDSGGGDLPGRVVELGQTAQLEGLQITVSGVNILYDRPEAPAGFAIFHVDYQIQNVGLDSVSSNTLSAVLGDDLGNLYALNPTASQLGNNPPLSGSIAAGQTVVATAGYQIPAGLSSTTIRWQVSIAGTGSQVQFNLPFQDATGDEALVDVQVQEATVSQDGGSLLVVGQITNLGEDTVVIDVTDVTLVGSSGTVFLKLSTNPAFPWAIPPDQTLLFGVTFQRPLGSDATFTVLNRSFQLSGIR